MESTLHAQKHNPRLGPAGKHQLRLLSFNIQAGVDTKRYHHYVTQSWKHVLPNRETLKNLNRIATRLEGYDLVGLQEVDAGSLRTGFLDQAEYLAQRARFPHWYRQVNRKIGKISQHSNALLSHYAFTDISEHKLPGLPGRGALIAKLGHKNNPLVICILHLALGRRARERQLAFVSELISDFRHVIVMGDMNCDSNSSELRTLMFNAELYHPAKDMHTFPSWRPIRSIDHVLLSPTLSVSNISTLELPVSDHLPVHIELELPSELELHRWPHRDQ